jgi:ribosomal protein S18 acetylase RimI-like enzyme
MIEIRRAQTEDDAALAEIDAATWSILSSPTPPREPGSGFFIEGRRAPDDILVAETDGVVAGYVMLRRSTPLPSHEHVLEVNGLGVDPRLQGQGVGRRLVEAAKQEASRRGARKLTLRVLSPNAGARRLYESCGFVVEGVLVGEFLLDGLFVDDVLMAWHVA